MRKYKRIENLIEAAGNQSDSKYVFSCTVLSGWKKIAIAFEQLCKEHKTSSSNVLRCLVEILLTNSDIEKQVIKSLKSKGLAGPAIKEYIPGKPTLYID